MSESCWAMVKDRINDFNVQDHDNKDSRGKEKNLANFKPFNICLLFTQLCGQFKPKPYCPI
jgi:hypothetical protein